MFSKFDLKKTIQSNILKTDLLDVRLALITNASFRKSNLQVRLSQIKSYPIRFT